MFKVGDKVKIDPELWAIHVNENIDKDALNAVGTIVEVAHTDVYPFVVKWEPKIAPAYDNWTQEGGYRSGMRGTVLVLVSRNLPLESIFSL